MVESIVPTDIAFEVSSNGEEKIKSAKAVYLITCCGAK